MKDKTADDAARFIQAVSQKQGWKINRDKEFVQALAAGLAKNYNRYGYFLCPCRDGDGDRQADRDVICPCDYVAEDQCEFGHCFCGLFLTAEFEASGRVPGAIPERREGGI